MPHRRAISTRPRPPLVPRGIAFPGVLAIPGALDATLPATLPAAALAAASAGGRPA